ncbi:M24 family metallopeptidase [Marinivivus vitaminiproducens]|uniref:M24 family metallopeptidase n=1 Tax=Marinivivus vitaminiproducens TaxID=3035935 RepID=UPI0027A7665A|nr:Xaa-Pro peptidase family protein [Geminicoccaceae bacterium SCSIO 64248]
MDRIIRERVDWEQPFPPEEYRARRETVLQAAAAAGYDGLVITSPRDYHYLTGHDHIWQYRCGFTGLYADVASGSLFLFDNPSHRNLISVTPEITDVAYHRRKGTPLEQAGDVVGHISQRGLGRGRIAIQTQSYGLHPDLVRRIGQGLAETCGAEIVEDDVLVEDVRLYKSPQEVAVVRQAAAIAVETMTVVRDRLRPGMAETEIDAVIAYESMRRGCGHPGIRTMIGSGPRSGAHHGPATSRALKPGDVLHIDFCTSLHRYHANLSRSFAIGAVDPRWHDLMDRSAGTTAAILEAVRPGDPFSAVQDAADRFIAKAGIDRERYEWFIGGYVLGIAFPPDWVHRHRPRSFDGQDDPVMQPGMVFNFEVQYDVFDGWPGGSGAAWIDTFLMTEDGLECLTELPRELVVIGI